MFVKILLTFLSVVLVNSDIGKLPYCLENFVPGLVLVSTIDGKFSAINSEGILQWQIDTEPGPLLTSNIHNLELTNSGKWIRLIPSLTGSLYRFDGNTIDPIPVTAESLLTSSFKYLEDLVIAGGLEVRTYGIGLRTGKIFYTCSSFQCINNTNNENEVDDILLLERNTQTVRAVDSQSGFERWNFSVGHPNIKLPQISCIDPNANLFNWNITAIIPDGLLLASKLENNMETTWQYQFPSPIVRVWKWNGRTISEINLFQVRTEKGDTQPKISPAIYLGMHKKQLYIHESYTLQHKLQMGTAVTEARSLIKIPWKPISASGLLTEDDSTAISILYSSEYVNGHGYYLYSENEPNTPKLCQPNVTAKFPALLFNSEANNFKSFIWFWWKEILVALLTVSIVFNFMLRAFSNHQQKQKVIFVERHVEVPLMSVTSSERISESSDSTFNSRYLNDFNTLRCLGKGGFGVVFEVKQKIDECHYAIKRIMLPKEESKREAVMREVKALAKLEHHNIVRYFNAWVEKPPYGWQQQHDNEWIKETTNEFSTENTTTCNKTETFGHKPTNQISDSFIVFNESCNSSHSQTEDNSIFNDCSNKTHIISYRENPDWSNSSNNLEKIEMHSQNPPVFLYIQMQLCQRQSLKEWLVMNNTRHSHDVLDMFKQIIAAVEYVHMQGLIHRDLKPSNIFFSLDGQIKVGDFGLVKVEEESKDVHYNLSSLKGHTKEVGTRLYMSPEQLSGKKYNYKVDIYSLGLIFFELLVYFSTDMERIKTLSDLRDNVYPKDFMEKFKEEYNLLKMMLCKLPEKRLTTFGIRARAPLNCCDSDYSQNYDFELPKSQKIRN